MGCNTSQEQKSAVTENNTSNNETNKSARNSAKSEKSSKSAKSEKLTNGHDNKSNDDDDKQTSEEQAATTIQKVYRGHKVRASMKQGDSSANSNNTKCETSANAISSASNEPEPTEEELKAEFREDDKELCDAAVRIQTAFRGHLARKVKEGTDQDLQEITKRVAEELDIDLNDPELNKAATKIQASFRGHKVRKDTTA